MGVCVESEGKGLFQVTSEPDIASQRGHEVGVGGIRYSFCTYDTVQTGSEWSIDIDNTPPRCLRLHGHRLSDTLAIYRHMLLERIGPSAASSFSSPRTIAALEKMQGYSAYRTGWMVQNAWLLCLRRGSQMGSHFDSQNEGLAGTGRDWQGLSLEPAGGWLVEACPKAPAPLSATMTMSTGSQAVRRRRHGQSRGDAYTLVAICLERDSSSSTPPTMFPGGR